MFLVIEAGLTVLALVLALTVPNLGSRWFEAVERSFGKLAQKRGLSVIVVGLTALALRAALLPILPIPQPFTQDEFCYLLLSDTFAHGRLTNPTNPMWAHFENLFLIWQPTYTSKYWPAQGLIMAFGQVFLGHPFWGVWLSVGLMCAAITWMLQAWVGEGWALLGGFLAVIRLGTFSYWANSYWGGAVAGLGGALVLGALPRIKQERRVRHALLMGLGFAILANSRPYEGLFFGIPVAVAMLVWLWKMKRPDLGRVLQRVMVPLLVALALTLIALGYYFWRVTGSPFRTPYMLYQNVYDPVPEFPWGKLKPLPDYRQPVFRQFYGGFEIPSYLRTQTAVANLKAKASELASFGAFFLGPLFIFPFLLAFATAPYGLSWMDVSPGSRFLVLVCAALLVGEALPIYYNAHYSAPVTCALYGLILAALRRVRTFRCRGKPSGLFVARAVPSLCVLLLVLRMGGEVYGWPPVSKRPGGIAAWCTVRPTNVGRVATVAKLKRYPGGQLVIVHFNPDHNVLFNTWVYNRADLASAKVIWAHDMGPAKNQELINYFKHRRVWLVDADDNPPRLMPYPESENPAESSR